MQPPFKRKIAGANPAGGTICSYRMNWYLELKQKLTAAGFTVIQEVHKSGAALAMVVAAPHPREDAKLRDRWSRTLVSIFRPYSANPVEKWSAKTGHAIPPELEGGTADASVIPVYPPQPGVYEIIFTPVVDTNPHDDSDEFTVAETIVDSLLDECVAVDLDGTLAKDSGWKGPEHIGEPVKPMLDLVKKLLDDGEDVVIFTARVHDGEKSTKEHIKQWLKDHDLCRTWRSRTRSGPTWRNFTTTRRSPWRKTKASKNLSCSNRRTSQDAGEKPGSISIPTSASRS
jgi:hypothetical protein